MSQHVGAGEEGTAVFVLYQRDEVCNTAEQQHPTSNILVVRQTWFYIHIQQPQSFDLV